MPEEQGGGTLTGSAGSMDFEGEDSVVLEGGVEILYQDVRVTAERMEWFRERGDLAAQGDVVFDQGPRRLSGSSLEYNLEEKTGIFREVKGYVTPDYFFEGSVVEKTGDTTFLIEDGVFTSCEADVPPWSFKTKKVKVEVDGFAKARNATLRVKDVPIFYLPYVLWPVKSDRTSGFLIPKPGYSSRRGASLGLGYYQTFGRSYDATLNLDLYSGGAPQGSVGTGNFFGVGTEFRYRPSEGTEGIFQGYAIRDPERDEWRWKIDYNHESRDLPLGFRGVISIEDVSDFDYFADFERRSDRNSRRRVYSQAYISKNWGSHSLNVLFDNRETFLSQDRQVTQRQLPEIDYKLRSTRIGKTPLYFQLKSSLHAVDVEQSVRRSETYGRGDIFPEITLPIRSRPWLSLSFTAGGALHLLLRQPVPDGRRHLRRQRDRLSRRESVATGADSLPPRSWDQASRASSISRARSGRSSSTSSSRASPTATSTSSTSRIACRSSTRSTACAVSTSVASV